MINKKLYNKKAKATIAISQILILVIAIVAISWMIGGNVKVVSAAGSGETCTGTCIDINTQGCSLSTITLLCPGPSNIQCCTGTVSTKSTTTTPAATPATSGSSTNPCASSKFCGLDNNVYSGTLVAGNCIASINLIETCKYGCQFGVCNQKGGESINIFDTVSKIGGAAQATKTTVDLFKKGAKALKLGKAGQEIAPVVDAAAKAAAPSLGGTILSEAGGSAGGAGMYSVSTLSVIGVSAAYVVVFAGLAFLAGRYIGALFGLNTQQSQSLGYSAAIGAATGYILSLIIGGSAGGPVGAAAGAVVAFFMFAILGKKSSLDVVQYTCSQWDAPSGKGLTPTQMTDRCKACNNQKDLPCTEYQCRSLGQGCVLVNDEATKNQLCIWNNTKDILPPVITPWKEALYPSSSDTKDFAYTPDTAISPPDKGVKITYIGTQHVSTDGTTKCAPPFTPVSFGVSLNKPAKCKISPTNIPSYAEMADIFMGRGIRDYNQSFTLTLPSKEAMEAENITVDNGGKYELYVRCEDANGNVNIGNFVFKFCISQGPDITPPAIIGTSILDQTPIAYNQSTMPIELYLTDQTFTKENASCRWSRLDKNYNAMENNLSCGHSLLDMNSQLAYTCRGNLTGLKDRQSNKFYFRCIDDLGNANTQSYPLALVGTAPLKIDKVGPTGIIRDSKDIVSVGLTVETSGGNDDGKAICAFSETGLPGSYIDFFYGYDVEPFSTNIHSQELGLTANNYTYFMKCRDQGGNTDEANVTFKVEIDTSPPIVVRVYRDEETDTLKIITDELSDCVYSNTNCDYIFSTGTAIDSSDRINHNIPWDISKDFYIKCKDQYGKIPPEKECSIIARPFEIFQLQ
jgi:hypothetical protein